MRAKQKWNTFVVLIRKGGFLGLTQFLMNELSGNYGCLRFGSLMNAFWNEFLLWCCEKVELNRLLWMNQTKNKQKPLAKCIIGTTKNGCRWICVWIDVKQKCDANVECFACHFQRAYGNDYKGFWELTWAKMRNNDKKYLANWSSLQAHAETHCHNIFVIGSTFFFHFAYGLQETCRQ